MSMKKPGTGEENWQTIAPGKPGGGVVTDGKGKIVGRTVDEEALEGGNENSATSSSPSTSPSTPAIDKPRTPPAK